MITVAFYARVSSEKQAQENTVASQITALENRISEDGNKILDEFKFIDNGYSGSNLVRPALEKLRDKVAGGEIDKIYIHSPDRLSRKYAYQMILLEEFQKSGAEIIFLNYQTDDSPESHLLLQMQGMIAEYERAKIIERHRRGKLHAAKRGSVNALSGSPYGYRYVDKYTGSGQALYEIVEEEAEAVRKIFSWIGQDRLTIRAVSQKLSKEHLKTRTGKTQWNRSVILGMLKNPAYKGQAAFGKTKVGKRLPRIRPYKNSHEQSRCNYSIYSVEKENWISIPVPAIIEESLFEVVQEQLAENRKMARASQRGAVHLLQGLIECQRCHYAFYGKPVRNKRGEKIDSYAYYRCIGTDAYRFGGNKICDNKQIRTDTLEIAVWEEVKFLLKNPKRISDEYQRRILELEKSPLDKTSDSIEKQENKLQRGISRLIDSYAQEDIEKEEFEPRIKAMKKHLKLIQEQKKKIKDQKKIKNELTLIITNLERFSSSIESKLEDLDWPVKRDIIRTLVKRIEINFEDVNVVFRVQELSGPIGQDERGGQESLQHCCGSARSRARASDIHRVVMLSARTKRCSYDWATHSIFKRAIYDFMKKMVFKKFQKKHYPKHFQ
jgi:site-specific DNA recombinase